MKKFEEQLKEHSGHMRLTNLEKRSMRLAIQEHMRINPLVAVKSPWGSWMFRVRFAAPAVAAVLLCTGTAYAAEGALPGDLLYPIKVNVNEPVEVALATTPQAKADVEAQIAQTRVTEAQALAARGTLTATTTQELQTSFNTYAAGAIAEANQVLPQTATTTASTTITVSAVATTSPSTNSENKNFASRLQISLNAQASILNNLSSQIEHRETRSHEEGGYATSTPEYPQIRTYRQNGTLIPNTIPPITGISTSTATTSIPNVRSHVRHNFNGSVGAVDQHLNQ